MVSHNGWPFWIGSGFSTAYHIHTSGSNVCADGKGTTPTIHAKHDI